MYIFSGSIFTKKPNNIFTIKSVAYAVFVILFAPIAGSETVEAKTVLEVTRDDCSRLITYQSSNDVTYTPGVTARGKKVVSADLNSQPIVLPDIIKIPITVDMFERYNIPANQDNFTAEATIGTVEVHRNGRAYFNGQPLQSEEQRDLALKCQKIMNNE